MSTKASGGPSVVSAISSVSVEGSEVVVRVSVVVVSVVVVSVGAWVEGVDVAGGDLSGVDAWSWKCGGAISNLVISAKERMLVQASYDQGLLAGPPRS